MGRGGRGEEEKDRYGARVRAFLNTVSFFFFFNISVQSCIVHH